MKAAKNVGLGILSALAMTMVSNVSHAGDPQACAQIMNTCQQGLESYYNQANQLQVNYEILSEQVQLCYMLGGGYSGQINLYGHVINCAAIFNAAQAVQTQIYENLNHRQTLQNYCAVAIPAACD